MVIVQISTYTRFNLDTKYPVIKYNKMIWSLFHRNSQRSSAQTTWQKTPFIGDESQVSLKGKFIVSKPDKTMKRNLILVESFILQEVGEVRVNYKIELIQVARRDQ